MTVEVNGESQNFYQMPKNLFTSSAVRIAMLFCCLFWHLVLHKKLYDFKLLLISTGKNNYFQLDAIIKKKIQ